jgi:hypothetical protein
LVNRTGATSLRWVRGGGMVAKRNVALAEKFIAVAKRNVALAAKLVAFANCNVALADRFC